MERDRHARATAQYFKLLAGWDASKILQNKPRLLKEVERMRGKKGYVCYPDLLNNVCETLTINQLFSLLSLSNWSRQSVEYFLARAICAARDESLPNLSFPKVLARLLVISIRSQAQAWFPGSDSIVGMRSDNLDNTVS
jgi:hypothetical protein